ncbi:MAG: hypothetical protein ACOYL5_05015 [Phototrophicaceae bacterium]|jgi:hypothetical protein
MPVLLLARGDQESRTLLKEAIEARYGSRPPLIETMRLAFNGKTRVKLGPLVTWVPLELKAQFKMPNSVRWDFTAKPVGVAVMRGIESYDGSRLHIWRGGNTQSLSDVNVISSAQQRLWAIAATLLTPLSDHFVELKAVDGFTLTAHNSHLQSTVTIQFDADYHIDQVWVNCHNSETNRVQRYTMRVDQELAVFNEVLIPRKFLAYWDDEVWFEAEPTAVDNNPVIDDSVFTLASEVVIS